MMHPYALLTRRLVLPPRKPKGSVQNIKRCFIVAAALHQRKVARMSRRWQDKHKDGTCMYCNMRVRFKTGV